MRADTRHRGGSDDGHNGRRKGKSHQRVVNGAPADAVDEVDAEVVPIDADPVDGEEAMVGPALVDVTTTTADPAIDGLDAPEPDPDVEAEWSDDEPIVDSDVADAEVLDVVDSDADVVDADVTDDDGHEAVVAVAPAVGVLAAAAAARATGTTTRTPLVVTLPRPRRRKGPVVAGALVAAAALVGVGVLLGAGGGDGDTAAVTVTTTPEVLAAAVAPTTAVAATSAVTTAPGTTAPATTAPATTAAPSTTPATAPATTAAPATTVAPTTAPSAAAAAPAATPAATGGDELPDLFTPVRWAIFKGGRVELFGRVPSQAVADTIATKATAVVGPGNVDVRYLIDPSAPLPASAPLYVRDTVQFGPGSAVVAPQFKPLLDLGVLLMQQNPGVKIWVMGRADNVGDPNANLFLSLDRAQAVIDYIVATGIDPARLIPVPLGTDAALGDNATPEGRAQNRSVEFVISGLLN